MSSAGCGGNTRSALRAGAALILVLLLLTARGATEAQPGELPSRLSLEEAVSLALSRNPDLFVAEFEREKAQVALERARYAADELREERIQSYELARVKEVIPRQALLGLRVAERAVEEARRGMRLRVEGAYFGVLLAREMEKVKEEAVRLAGEQRRLAEAGVRAGTRARLDVLAARAQEAQAQAELASARRERKVAEMELNRLLHFPLTHELELLTPLQETVPDDPLLADPEKALQAAEKVSLSLLQAEEKVEAARVAFQVAARWYTPNVFAYREAQAELWKAEAERERARTELELSVRRAILEVEEAASRIEQGRQAVAFLQEALRLARLRYEAGVGTNAEVLDAQVRLGEARVALARAVFGLNSALSRFRSLTGQ